MSSDEDIGLLRDMLVSAKRIATYIAGMRFDDFETDERTQDAVIYRLGIVGEAARWVSDDVVSVLPLDWIGIRAMRNRLFHGYRELKLDIIWATAVDDLPRLVTALEEYLR